MHWQQSASIIPLFIGNMICNFFWFYFKWKSTIMIVLEMPVGCFVKWTLNGLGSFEVVEALLNWFFWYIMRILLNYHYIWILLGPELQYFHFNIIFDDLSGIIDEDISVLNSHLINIWQFILYFYFVSKSSYWALIAFSCIVLFSI